MKYTTNFTNKNARYFMIEMVCVELQGSPSANQKPKEQNCAANYCDRSNRAARCRLGCHNSESRNELWASRRSSQRLFQATNKLRVGNVRILDEVPEPRRDGSREHRTGSSPSDQAQRKGRATGTIAAGGSDARPWGIRLGPGPLTRWRTGERYNAPRP
jgi:hypothetical protein